MKFFIYWILIITIIGVNSAPKKFKKFKSNFNKKCNQCKLKGHDTFYPVCGRLNDIEETFESRTVFECFVRCRQVEYFEFLYDGECRRTPEQCKAECDQSIPLSAPPGCEGHPSGLKEMTTYPYEAVLDCYINCPENNLTKLHQGPCIHDRHHPIYKHYGVLAPYHVCFNRNDPLCKNKKLEAIRGNYFNYPIRRRRFFEYSQF